MKILFPYMARWFSENWTRYHSLLEALGEMGHEIHVLQPPSMESEETNFREIETRSMKNFVFHDVDLNNFIWNTNFPLNKIVKKAYYSIATMRQAKKIVENESIDVVLIYNIPQYNYINFNDVTVVFDYADDYIDMLSYELGNLDIKPIRFIASKLLNNMLLKSDHVFSVSNELAKDTIGNIKVLPNGVDSKYVIDLDEVDVNSNEKFTVGFIGSFEYFIDFDLILNSAKLLPDCEFLLVGRGRDYEMVKNSLKDQNINNVKLVGGVPHNQIFSYIDKMDVCLNIFKPLPVSHRACPIKLFEYLSRYKPVISNRLDELEYIDSDSFIYYADTSDELVQRINEIRKNYNQAMLMAGKGNTVVREQYTWESIAQKFVDLAR